ncbi:hypothetical protein TD95_000804 [Thielaviopsis punctulata]|uniref:Molybdopterin synthase catalytic subunit n=1 Tax=Thielaviopsis punctulata TaxID=72032 RepID=A0A0F4ZKS1_9PEZI|nr:hypothetical protein TD95_000804 [Thielaviopsis punctulata]
MTTPQQDQIWEIKEDCCYVGLTHDPLSVEDCMTHVRSNQAGAIVVFVGTTRDSFEGKQVKELQYSAYNRMALPTMMSICHEMVERFQLKGISMVHRLGPVPIGQDSVVIAVSSPHRQAAWQAGEEALEQCKARVEIWKKEEFSSGEGVWRANRDGAAGEPVDSKEEETKADGNSQEKKETKEKLELDLSKFKRPQQQSPMGPVIRPRRLGERGHGAVVNPLLAKVGQDKDK